MKKRIGTRRSLAGAIFFLALFVLVSLFFVNFMRQNHVANYSQSSIKTNLSTIATFDYSKVKNVEAQIRQLEETEARSTFDPSKILKPAQYQKLFNNCVVIGDSITEGLSAYKYLSEEQVFSEIGASVMWDDELFTAAANTYPRVAVIALGMNDTGNYNGDTQRFIKKYKQLIKDFQKISPDTVILVSGITPPTKKAIKTTPVFGNYKKFNTALEQMCKDLSLQYIDTPSIIKKHPDYYAEDGIHLSVSFYPLWLNAMIVKAGL